MMLRCADFTHYEQNMIVFLFLMQVVKQHIKRSLLEKELLYFGYEMFGKTFVDPVSVNMRAVLYFSYLFVISDKL